MVVAHNDETRPVAIRAGNFELRLAESDAEIEAAQALRYRVFYEEMAAAPTAEMAAAQRDFDAFDRHCDHLLVIDHRHVRRAARTALDVIASGPTAEKGPAIELAIVLAGDDEVRRLNRDYRGIDKSTNVLSFGDASDGRRRARGEPVILGDVVLARETVAEEAAAQGKSIADHSLHLVIHGILHLLGHGTGAVAEDRMVKVLCDLVDLSPRGIREHLGLNRPIYARTAAYGHFGRPVDADGGFSWERLDLVDRLRAALN